MKTTLYGLALALAIFVTPCLAGPPLQFIVHNLHFDRFDVDGFEAPSVIHTVHKDKRGRIWIGAETGLFLYDGNEVRSFQHNPDNSGGIPNSFVKVIAESADGTIWIGTWGGGLAFFDEATHSFEIPEIISQDILEYGNPFDKKIWSMAIDRQGRLWIGTFTSGLFRLDPRTGKMDQVFYSSPSQPEYLNRIDSLLVDRQNRVWFAPYHGGLRVINPDTLESAVDLVEPLQTEMVDDIAILAGDRIAVAHYQTVHILDSNGRVLHEIDATSNASNNQIMEILPYSENALLAGTAGGGLWYLDIETAESFQLPAGKHQGAMEPSITWDMDISAEGDILVGGTTGLWIAPATSRQFWTVSGFNDGKPVFLTETRAIASHANRLYLNSGATIYSIDFQKPLDRPRSAKGEMLASVSGHRPLGMERDTSGVFWIGTDREIFRLGDDNVARPVQPRRGAHALLFDKQTGGVFAVAPWGLQKLGEEPSRDELQKLPTKFSDAGTPYPPQHISRGLNNDMWTGTFSGLQRFDIASGKMLPVFSRNPQLNAWKDPYTNFVHTLSDKELLIGTGSGLWRAKLNASGEITSIDRTFADQPFSEVAFTALVNAADGRLLLATDLGLLEYNPSDDTFQLLTIDEGFPSYDVYGAGFRQFDDGLAILSGHTGPLLFYPDEVNFSTEPRDLLITDITSFRGNDTKPWSIHSRNLQFRYEDRVVRFKFGLLDYLNPMNDRYAIRLSGFQDAWLDLGGLNEFSFTNLDPGAYRLDLRVTEGLTGKGASTSVSFDVLPPWWRTWWAYALYALAFFGSIFWYWLSLQRKLEREREISQRLREADRIKSHFLNELETKVEDATQDLRHAVEALEIKNVELDAAQQRALDASRLKSEFLANMSHEIRTPMNGVLGFTQLLRKSALDNDQQDYVETIEKSAKSLLGIINDVLDVSKIEAGKLMIDSTGFDLRQCISDSLEALAPVAYEKQLELIGCVDENVPDGLRGDPTRLRQMITNLIGNSIKFTGSGHVLLHARIHADDDGAKRLRVSVSDTGRGIAAEDRERLFHAFERGNVNLAGHYAGTGLGLVITKKLCEAMGGHIELDSTPGKGTSIVLDLPLIVDRNPENRYGFGKPLSGRRVLLIDPHPQSREALRARLVHWGARVTAMADLTAEHERDEDIAVIGIGRTDISDPARIKSLCKRLPETLPRLCLVAAADHEILHSVSDACGAACISKVGHLEGQLRRMAQLLNISRDETRVVRASGAIFHLKGLHVLVADDNRINRYFLKKILEAHGARVTEADSGTAVLRVFGSEHNVDVALLDIHMPDMDGLEVARRIRAGGNMRLPLLAVSANVQPETYEAAVSAGINDYLLKPVEEMKLVEAVLEWTGREATAET